MPYKIAMETNKTLDICNITKYSTLEHYTIWEVDFIPERIVDLSKTKLHDPTVWIDSVVDLIYKYKIVYFINLVFEYFDIFERINNEFTTRFGYGGSK